MIKYIPAVPVTVMYSMTVSKIRLSPGGGLVMMMQTSTVPIVSLTVYWSCSKPIMTAKNNNK